jgi:cellulose synthase/poly-beta-1,6-N-acetylglucosamine synthase-like glycosyltransferase
MPKYLQKNAATASLGREIVLTRLLLAVTLGAAALGLTEVARLGRALALDGDWASAGGQALFAMAFGVLVFGSAAYQLARLGYLRRRRAHAPRDRTALDALFSGLAPALTVLVPSYKEEVAVVRRTLLSAALQEYPQRRVVLLIDDPWQPRDPSEAAGLDAMRGLVPALQARFDAPARHFAQVVDECKRRRLRGEFDEQAAATLAARCLDEAARWFEEEIARGAGGDHAQAVLCNEVLERWRRAHRARAVAIARRAAAGGFTSGEALHEVRRLAVLFQVEFASFERKRYENLSHEPNKAMNLNAYIALMGRSLREVRIPHGTGLQLQETARERATLHIPDAEFIVTLDADSVLAPDYALRLVHLMTQPGNERVAVAQTPYSAFPNAPGLLERMAGAQTDIQYLVHQGFTGYDATFWVGANALLRKAALEDIATSHVERGHRVVKYVQDRTPIEDTESSVDLADRGWTLCNYPERLAWSATPPDFGALLIQRRRWANGGLIILPKALRYLARGPWSRRKSAEGLLRIHYLASVAAVNVAFLLVMFGPFERNLAIAWIPLSMAPYMLAYARDLVHCGYRWSDLLRVFALNLLLLPVNLGGTLRSLHQAATGTKSAFCRTPKVTGRTAAPGAYVLAECALLAASAATALVYVQRSNMLGAAFAMLYVSAMAYAILRFIGWRNGFEDLRLWLQLRALPATLPEPEVAAPAAVPAGGAQLVSLAEARARRRTRPDRGRKASAERNVTSTR